MRKIGRRGLKSLSVKKPGLERKRKRRRSRPYLSPHWGALSRGSRALAGDRGDWIGKTYLRTSEGCCLGNPLLMREKKKHTSGIDEKSLSKGKDIGALL